MIQMNLFTKQKQTYRYQKTNLGYQRGNMWVGGVNQEHGMNIYTLPHIRWITNSSLLYITGNSAQYSVITYMRKESLKNEYICITESLCRTTETNTTL